MKNKKFKQVFYYLLPCIPVGFGLYVANNIWIAMLGYHLFAVLILFREKQGYQIRRIFNGGSIKGTMLWSFFALASGGAIYLLGVVLNISDTLCKGLLLMGLSGYGWLFFIVYYSLVNPFIEEVYWRGFLGSESKSFTCSDIGYAGYHPLVFLKFLSVPWAIFEFVVLAAVAWFWRGMVKKHGGLRIPFAMHLSADLSIAAAIWLLVKG
jgi:uncharacterized protein